MKFLISGIILYLGFGAAIFGQGSTNPNILLIFCDDLIEISDAFGPGFQAYTPNITRLRERGVSFTNTCSNASICGPSRASMFTGILPVTSGHFGYKMSAFPWSLNPLLGSSTTMFKHFKNNGYGVYATGKIFHAATSVSSDFTELFTVTRGPFAWDGTTVNGNGIAQQVAFPGNPAIVAKDAGGGIAPFSELELYPGYQWIYSSGQIFDPNNPEHLTMDEQIADYGINLLQQEHESPFFIALGFYAAHTPLYAPDRFFDLYPLAGISTSTFIDEPESARTIAVEKNRWNSVVNTPSLTRILQAGADHAVDNYWLKKYIQGYLSLVSLVDEQLGLLLDALDESPYADNTYVVFSSDHGFQLGEKNMIKKNTLWNAATRVPLIIAGPGIGNDIKLNNPTSLVDVYPSLLDLTALPNPTTHSLDGHSLAPLLTGAPENFTGPGYVLASVPCNEELVLPGVANKNHQHYTLFGNTYRYNYYSTGEEELYLAGEDPLELVNIIAAPEYQLARKQQRDILTVEYGISLVAPAKFNSLFYGNFNQNLNGWVRSNAGPNTLNILSDQSAEDIGNYMRITKVNTDPLFGALNRSLELKQGHDYEVCFNARGVNYNGALKFEIQSDTEYSNSSSIINQFATSVTNTWQTYCYNFTEIENEGRFSRMLLVAPTIQGSVDIDNIVFTDITEKSTTQAQILQALEIVPATTYPLSINTISANYSKNFTAGCFNSGSAIVSLQGWYKFISPSKELNIWAMGNSEFDVAIELYSNIDTSPLYCANEVAASETEILVAKNLIIGNTYYVRITHAELDVVNNNEITTGIIYVASTGLIPTYCNAGSFNSLADVRLTSLPEYSNLTNWQLAIQTSVSPTDTILINLPPTIPPVFNFQSSINTLVPNAIYTVRARARQFVGPIWGEYGPSCILTYLPQSGLPGYGSNSDLISNDRLINVFPNPSNGQDLSVFISDASIRPSQMVLYDQTGRMLNISTISDGNGNFQIVPVSSLAAGLYSLVLIFEDGSKMSRLIAVTKS